jgi:hypothetical protein
MIAITIVAIVGVFMGIFIGSILHHGFYCHDEHKDCR